MTAHHTVQYGESAASIAHSYTGDASRERELILANPQKKWANVQGRIVFTDLHAGEQLHVPMHWQPHLAHVTSLVHDEHTSGLGQLPAGWSRDHGLGWVYYDPTYPGWAYVWRARQWTYIGQMYATAPASSACTKWSQPFGTPQRKAEIAAGMGLPSDHTLWTQEQRMAVQTKFAQELSAQLLRTGASLLNGSGGQPVAAQLSDQNTYLFTQGARNVLVQQCFDAGMVHGVAAAPVHLPPHIERVAAMVHEARVGIGDTGSVNQELATLQGIANTAPYADQDGSYSGYVKAAKDAGNTAVTQLGPDIDNTWGINNTGTGTHAAWGINGTLAGYDDGDANSSNPATYNDAIGAQGKLNEMVSWYQTAIAAGMAANPPGPTGGGGGGGAQPQNVIDAANAAAAAINADPNYCSSVHNSGSAVNHAVHNFKTAWNAANPGNKVPVGTGNFEAPTANALAQTLGGAGPAGCGGGGGGPHPGPTGPTGAPGPTPGPTGGVTPVNLVKCPDGSMVASGQACPGAKTNWLPWVVGGVAVAAGIGLVVYAQSRKTAAAPTPRTPTRTPPATPPAGAEYGYGYESNRHMRRYY